MHNRSLNKYKHQSELNKSSLLLNICSYFLNLYSLCARAHTQFLLAMKSGNISTDNTESTIQPKIQLAIVT